MREDLDEDIEIDIRRAVEAYSSFKPTDEINNKNMSVGKKDAIFNRCIQSVLQDMGVAYHPNDKFIGSKQTISNWNRNGVKTSITKKRSVLLAVMNLTGIDISKRSILARHPVEFSKMIELGEVRAQKMTNDPDEIEDVVYHVVLSSILFKTSRMKVMSSWVKGSLGQDYEIGTVEYGLNEAYLETTVNNSEVVDWCRRLPDDENRGMGRADGCILLWSDNISSWIIQPTSEGSLRARMENANLLTVRSRRGDYADLRVKASAECIEDHFRLRSDGQLAELTHVEKLRARERLAAIIIRKGNKNATILAMHRCKLP